MGPRKLPRGAKTPGAGSRMRAARWIALAAAAPFLGACNRSIEGDFLVLRHMRTIPDTGWIRLDGERTEHVRSLMAQSSYRRQSSSVLKATSTRWLRVAKGDTTLWEGAFLAPNCVASDTDAYCVPADDSDALNDLEQAFR